MNTKGDRGEDLSSTAETGNICNRKNFALCQQQNMTYIEGLIATLKVLATTLGIRLLVK